MKIAKQTEQTNKIEGNWVSIILKESKNSNLLQWRSGTSSHFMHLCLHLHFDKDFELSGTKLDIRGEVKEINDETHIYMHIVYLETLIFTPKRHQPWASMSFLLRLNPPQSHRTQSPPRPSMRFIVISVQKNF